MIIYICIYIYIDPSPCGVSLSVSTPAEIHRSPCMKFIQEHTASLPVVRRLFHLEPPIGRWSSSHGRDLSMLPLDVGAPPKPNLQLWRTFHISPGMIVSKGFGGRPDLLISELLTDLARSQEVAQKNGPMPKETPLLLWFPVETPCHPVVLWKILNTLIKNRINMAISCGENLTRNGDCWGSQQSAILADHRGRSWAWRMGRPLTKLLVRSREWGKDQ